MLPPRKRRRRTCVTRAALAKGPGNSAEHAIELLLSSSDEEVMVEERAASVSLVAVRASALVKTPYGRGIVTEVAREGTGILGVQLGWGVVFIREENVTMIANPTVLRCRRPSPAASDPMASTEQANGRQSPATIAQRSVSLTRSDIFRLNEGFYLNDSLIDFDLRRIAPALARIHAAVAFTSFFLEQLQRGGHASVARWTRGVDVFAQRFILVPVHNGDHWSLAIVCHPGAALVDVRALKDGTRECSADLSTGRVAVSAAEAAAAAQREVACIVCLDSMSGLHRTQKTCRALRSWLTAEWATRNGDGAEPRRRFTPGKMPSIAPHVAQQANLVDCGVYALHFADAFIQAFGPNGVTVRHLVERDTFEALGRGFVPRRKRSAMQAHVAALIAQQERAAAAAAPPVV